jgi:two-component system, chemotaxis family, chemotaxis protein CheY
VTCSAKAILLVDDSATVRRMLEWTLRPSGFKILQAGDGLEALEVLKGHDVDLAIVDLNMPHMDGIELIRTVRGDERLKGLPVILLTTENREEDRDLAREAGANLFLSKPSTPSVIRLHVFAMLGLAPAETKP